MSETRPQKYAEEVRLLIEERLKIKGKTLEKALSRAGRLLPKWAHRDGRYLVQAAQFTDHPKLRLIIDDQKVEKAHEALVTHLKTLDPKDRRKGQLLGIVGVISFNLILIVAGLIIFLIWRGYL